MLNPVLKAITVFTENLGVSLVIDSDVILLSQCTTILIRYLAVLLWLVETLVFLIIRIIEPVICLWHTVVSIQCCFINCTINENQKTDLMFIKFSHIVLTPLGKIRLRSHHV